MHKTNVEIILWNVFLFLPSKRSYHHAGVLLLHVIHEVAFVTLVVTFLPKQKSPSLDLSGHRNGETFNFGWKISLHEFIHRVCEISRGEAGRWSMLCLWQGLAVWQELSPSTVPAACAHSEALKPSEHCESCVCLWLALGSVLLPNYFSRPYIVLWNRIGFWY